ncbi:Holliday junction branch migration DNA helicase RuvB [[Mycoplasma] testudinis]|uniref:Holliday junction branch migration DNA helicase RuvB n=1 Tax=[Mycoplasma] testudinis TaxID=33924 RepID=UPI000489EF79|nr:Holliday junction branch migration DNA helicase RuvB [[Mycoplasma] testudinis]
MNTTRPKSFSEFVGKDNVKNQLQTFIQASLLKKQQLTHTLFYGPPGVGKTSLAIILANTLNVKIKILQAPHIQKPSDLLNALSIINKGDVLFIDEIHALPPNIMEILFPLMEDFSIDIVMGKEFNSKMTRMKLPTFTLVGATTQFGRILNPLEERFGIVVHLDYYEFAEIKKIVEKHLTALNLKMNEKEVDCLVSCCRYTPRTAIRLVERLADYKLINKNISIDEILQQLQIYDLGLNQQDINYLKVLAANVNTPLGAKSISLITGIDIMTLETKLEPFLLKIQLIRKTARGRVIDQKGIAYLKSHHFI